MGQLKRKEENEKKELKRKEEHKKQEFAEMTAKQKQRNAIKEANEKKILKAKEATSKRIKEEQEKKVARQNAEKAAEEKAKIREKSQQLHSGKRLQEGQLKAEATANSKKAVDCAVEWSAYTKCSKTCGGGTQKRTVKKVTRTPLHGGKVCPKEEVRDCNIKACSIAQRIVSRGRSIIKGFKRLIRI